MITMRGLGNHLTNDTITPAILACSSLSSAGPQIRSWSDQIFGTKVPDLVINQIKTACELKDVWAKLKVLKVLYEGKSRECLILGGRQSSRISSWQTECPAEPIEV